MFKMLVSNFEPKTQSAGLQTFVVGDNVVMLDMIMVSLLPIDVPCQLGRRFGSVTAAVDLDLVPDVIPRIATCDHRPFVRQIWNRNGDQ